MKSFLFVLAVLAALTARAADRPGRKLSTPERLEPQHLKAVHEARENFAKLANAPAAAGGDGVDALIARAKKEGLGIYNDYRAVIHVHAEDSNHTGGKRAGVLEATKKTGVKVVMLSDHRGPKADTWRGVRDGVLFFAGSEEEGLLRFPMFDDATGKISSEDLKFLCHIEERYDAPSEGFVGMEIYNRHTDTKDDDDFNAWFLKLVPDTERWREFVALYKKYPDEIFGAGTDYWPEIFAKWDKETKTKAFTGIAANDAHENQVFNGLMLDPYEVSFRNLSTHILARELTDASIRQSLREGHVYVSHDWLCDPTGFAFIAQNNLGVFNMGDPVTLVGSTRLIATTPIPAKIKLFKNGELKEEKTGDRITFETKADGTYRVEAWLEVDGEERPWIYSNPVYLKTPDLFTLAMAMPSMETKPNVIVRKDIIYTDGKPEEEAKHKLDIYLPKDKTNAPVFFFVHGGAWVSGDRTQYPPLGNRFAGEGIVTVVPSYRLAPKFPFPAQIEDVAAAFAWTVRHIADFGGDTNRIYVGGHSAGGHLSALLSLDSKYLDAHHISSGYIKGAACLSGVYDLGDMKDNVFGKDPAVHRDASPLAHIHRVPLPFLVTYCEWDYFPLALQAKDFQSALEKIGNKTKLVYVPKESHISEMLSVTKDDDLTVKSVKDFILH